MKAKVVKSAKKRITNVTKSGKFLHRRLSAQHLTSGKSKRVLRASNKTSDISKADFKKIKSLILK